MMSSVAILERPPFGRPFHLRCMLPYHRRDDGSFAFAPFTIFSNKLNFPLQSTWRMWKKEQASTGRMSENKERARQERRGTAALSA